MVWKVDFFHWKLQKSYYAAAAFPISISVICDSTCSQDGMIFKYIKSEVSTNEEASAW